LSAPISRIQSSGFDLANAYKFRVSFELFPKTVEAGVTNNRTTLAYVKTLRIFSTTGNVTEI
jgi:hypothetical protein